MKVWSQIWSPCPQACPQDHETFCFFSIEPFHGQTPFTVEVPETDTKKTRKGHEKSALGHEKTRNFTLEAPETATKKHEKATKKAFSTTKKHEKPRKPRNMICFPGHCRSTTYKCGEIYIYINTCVCVRMYAYVYVNVYVFKSIYIYI